MSQVSRLNFEGEDGTTVFSDENIDISWTALSGALISTDQSKLGIASGHFPSSLARIDANASSSWAFGVGDFTVEAWIYMTSYPPVSASCVVGNYSGASSGYWWFAVSGQNGLQFRHADTDVVTRTRAENIPLNQWVHIAASRKSGVLRLFIDGFQVGENATFNVNLSQSAGISIGNVKAFPNNNLGFIGYIDIHNIDKGIGKYDEDFTPPYSIIRAISGTITESVGVTNWHVRAYRLDNGQLEREAQTTNGTFSLEIYEEFLVPYMVTVTPEQGGIWRSEVEKVIGDLIFPTQPSLIPYYFKATSTGTTGETEPSWNNSPGGSTVDGEVTWECVERMVQPITHGPLIPTVI